jgi:NADH:ubiquinone oxidoreductase subunit 6 (subunit J)
MELGIFVALALVMVGASAWAVFNSEPEKVVWGLAGATLGAVGLAVLAEAYSIVVALVLGGAGLGTGLFCLKMRGTMPSAVFTRETHGISLAALVLAIIVVVQVDWMLPPVAAMHEKPFMAVGTRLFSKYILPMQCMALVLLTALVGVAVFIRSHRFGRASDQERA